MKASSDEANTFEEKCVDALILVSERIFKNLPVELLLTDIVHSKPVNGRYPHDLLFTVNAKSARRYNEELINETVCQKLGSKESVASHYLKRIVDLTRKRGGWDDIIFEEVKGGRYLIYRRPKIPQQTIAGSI